jgi:hypothetical protein
VAGNIDGLMIFIHENICLRIKPIPYRIPVRRLSSIFVVKSAKEERGGGSQGLGRTVARDRRNR